MIDYNNNNNIYFQIHSDKTKTNKTKQTIVLLIMKLVTFVILIL